MVCAEVGVLLTHRLLHVVAQPWVTEALSTMVEESLKLDDETDYPVFKKFGGSDRLFAGKSYMRDAAFRRKKKPYTFPKRYSGKAKYEPLHKAMMVSSTRMNY